MSCSWMLKYLGFKKLWTVMEVGMALHILSGDVAQIYCQPAKEARSWRSVSTSFCASPFQEPSQLREEGGGVADTAIFAPDGQKPTWCWPVRRTSSQN